MKNVKDFFEVYTGGNHNVATWTPNAIMDFALDYCKQLYSSSDMSTDIEGIRLLSINDVMNCVVGLGRERILMQLRNKIRENISECTSQPLRLPTFLTSLTPTSKQG